MIAKYKRALTSEIGVSQESVVRVTRMAELALLLSSKGFSKFSPEFKEYHKLASEMANSRIETIKRRLENESITDKHRLHLVALEAKYTEIKRNID